MLFTLGKAISLMGVVSGVLSTPLAKHRRYTSVASRSQSISFDNWGGLSSLSGFDSFYGSNNFYGSDNTQVVVVEQEEVCEVQQVTIIQQQLAILQEFAKRVITEQICDVETQVLVLEQFRGGLRSFRQDIRHVSGRDIGYDSNVASLISELYNSDGTINSQDFGFNGLDVGHHLKTPSGSNWNSSKSPQNINTILNGIAHSTSSSNSTAYSSNSNSTVDDSNSNSTVYSSNSNSAVNISSLNSTISDSNSNGTVHGSSSNGTVSSS